MATFLFVIISIIFIGLGLPDSLLGSAWPAIYPEFKMPISYANFVTILISSGTVVASFFSAKLINKFGTGIITAVSTALSAFALLGFALSNSILWFCILAIPLGFGAGAIDASLNNYVAVHYKSNYMSFLHCFYGVGVALSPYVMSFALNQNNNWRLGYKIIFLILFAIAVISFIALPLWTKVNRLTEEKESETKQIILPLKTMAKMSAVSVSWLMFFSSVALEFTCGIWGCTYLVSAQGLSESFSAKMLTLYYLGMTLGRIVSGLISSKLQPAKTVYVGYVIVATAITILLLPTPPVVKGVSLFFIGFGNGPAFPNLIYLTPIYFGKEVSRSIVGTQMTACNLGILLMPPVFGLIADYVNVKLFPVILAILFLTTLISTITYHKLAKNNQQGLKFD